MKADKGFTLIELMVAMVIAMIIIAGIYSVYHSQHRSHVVQEKVVEMQQNLRAGMFMMAREIRMAGANPTGRATTGIATIEDGTIGFSMDLHGKTIDDPPDGTTNDGGENITYALSGDDLVRTDSGVTSVVAENIDALDFVYLDADGNETTDALRIRSVQVTIVARTGKGDPGYTDTTTYYNQNNPPEAIYTATGDNFRRRRLATNIRCRNLGLL